MYVVQYVCVHINLGKTLHANLLIGLWMPIVLDEGDKNKSERYGVKCTSMCSVVHVCIYVTGISTPQAKTCFTSTSSLVR